MVTATWLLIPGVLWVLPIMYGLEVSMRSRILPESPHMGCFASQINSLFLVVSYVCWAL